METVQTFTADTLPSHFQWQLQDFARIVWNLDLSDTLETSLHPVSWNPTYFVFAKGQWVISSATVLWQTVRINTQLYKMYGLGLVMTYPVYRKQGYGREVVSIATKYIRQQADADMALLQTSPDLESFYAVHGWEHTPTVKALSGDVNNPVDEDGWYMMLFLSERAKQNRTQIEQNPFYLDKHIW